jgi:hypothetical protein
MLVTFLQDRNVLQKGYNEGARKRSAVVQNYPYRLRCRRRFLGLRHQSTALGVFAVCYLHIENDDINQTTTSTRKEDFKNHVHKPNLASRLWSGTVGWGNAKLPRPRDSRLTYPC